MLRNVMVLIAGVVLTASAAFAQVETGKTAPDFALQDTAGTEHRLSDYKGKVVLLEWSNPDCPFVRKFYGSGAMPKWQAQYTAQGVIWLSVNSSAPGKEGHYEPAELGKRLAADGFAGTAALVDPDGKVGRLYEAKTTPHIFVIDKAGKLVYEGAIDDKPSAEPEDIAMARNYAAAALEAVLAGKEVAVPATKSYGCSVKY